MAVTGAKDHYKYHTESAVLEVKGKREFQSRLGSRKPGVNRVRALRFPLAPPPCLDIWLLGCPFSF